MMLHIAMFINIKKIGNSFLFHFALVFKSCRLAFLHHKYKTYTQCVNFLLFGIVFVICFISFFHINKKKRWKRCLRTRATSKATTEFDLTGAGSNISLLVHTAAAWGASVGRTVLTGLGSIGGSAWATSRWAGTQGL